MQSAKERAELITMMSLTWAQVPGVPGAGADGLQLHGVVPALETVEAGVAPQAGQAPRLLLGGQQPRGH